MFESLGDPDKNCSRASTVMINCLLKERGNVLMEKVGVEHVPGTRVPLRARLTLGTLGLIDSYISDCACSESDLDKSLSYLKTT